MCTRTSILYVCTCSYRAISRTRHCPRVGAVLYAFGHILRFTSSYQWRHRFRNCVFTPLQKRRCCCFLRFVLFTSHVDRSMKFILHVSSRSSVHFACFVWFWFVRATDIFLFLTFLSFRSTYLIIAPYCTRFCSPYGNGCCRTKHNLRAVRSQLSKQLILMRACVIAVFFVTIATQKKRAQVRTLCCSSYFWTWNNWHLDLSRSRFKRANNWQSY